MKVQLLSKDGINTLKVEGEIDAHAISVLKAGVTKLLKDGKNKIIVDVELVSSIPPDLIREMAVLDITAKELAGTILLSGVSAEKREEVKNFAKTAVIQSYTTQEQAVQFIQSGKQEEDIPELGAIGTVAEWTRKLELKDKEIAALKEQMALINADEIKRVRAAHAEVATKCSQHEAEMAKFIEERNKLMDAVVASDRIAQLEDTVQELTKKIQTQKP